MTFRNTFCAPSTSMIFFVLFIFVLPLTVAAQEKIAFVSDRDGNNEIYVMNADGSNQTRVTNQVSDDLQPSISPNGRKIVFASNANGEFNIFIVDVNGTNRIRLTDDPGTDLMPVFSPDGTKIAFSTDRDGVGRIYIMNTDGTNQTPASPDTSTAAYPSFSPDGTKILYASDRDGNFEIYRSEISGLNQTRLTNNLGFDGQPVYNGNASKICFRSNRDGNDEIYIMNADGSAPVRLTQSPGLDFAPVFSPDGTKIAFTSDRDGTLQIYTVNVSGQDQVPVTSSANGGNSDPSWADPTSAPPELSNMTVTQTIDEGQNATLAGDIFSGDPNENISLSVNWGDGSLVQIFNYPAGTTSFSEHHQYLDDPPTGPTDDAYSVAATLSTVHGSSNASTFTKVSNVDPIVTVSLSGPVVAESPLTLKGAITDPSTLDTHTVNINWGDGSTMTSLDLAAGVTNFSANHTYATPGAYTITVNASDDDGGKAAPVTQFLGVVPLPTSGKIAFTSNYGGNNNIWLMNSNGTGQKGLTTNPASDSYPNISKDGSKIVFVSERDGNPEIYTMDATGAFQTRLTNNAAIESEPVFSPNGTKIVFASNRDGNHEIYIMNANGTGQTRLTTNTVDDGQAEFSPDGTKIIFSRLAANQTDAHIYTMDLNGGNQTPLTSGSFVLNGQPSYNFDGSKVVFSSVRPFSGFSEPEIFIMDANGGNQVRMTTAGGYDMEPVFSPDGTKIAFRSERDGNAEIYIMDVNGANQQRITFDGAGVSNFAPSWASVPIVGVDIADDLAAEQGAVLTIPILVTDTTGKGIISYDFTLNYDPTVLTPQPIAFDKTSTLSAGFQEVNAGISAPGQLVISGFGTTPLTGAGTLLNLKFNVIGTAPTSSDLTLSPFMFNEGLPMSDVTAGRVFVQGTISGRVTYGTSATTVGVPAVTLNAAGSPNASTTTAADGTYRLGGFGPGAYTVTPSKTGDVSPTAISALDASLVSQFLVGATSLTANQQAAGEVSGNGSLTSFDAAQIALYVALLPSTGSTGTWRFSPASRNYVTVGTLINEDYSAILMGEVSGNWTSSVGGSFAQSMPMTEVMTKESPLKGQPPKPSSPIATVTIASIKVKANQTVAVPITVKFTGQTPSIGAYQFDVLFDPQVIQPDTVAADTSGTLSSGLSAITNSTISPGRMRVVVYGSSPFAGNGTLINLIFRAVGKNGSSSNLSLANLLLNEGNPTSEGKAGKISINR